MFQGHTKDAPIVKLNELSSPLSINWKVQVSRRFPTKGLENLADDGPTEIDLLFLLPINGPLHLD